MDDSIENPTAGDVATSPIAPQVEPRQADESRADGLVSRDEEPGALVTRLRIIEDQPLQTRAEALAQLHDELRSQLESGDAARPHA